jgi:hypothetical protein
MRLMNLLTAVMAAGLVAAPAVAFAQGGGGGSEGGVGAGSNTIHCSSAKIANAAADPNCAQRDPPMPARGASTAPRNSPPPR